MLVSPYFDGVYERYYAYSEGDLDRLQGLIIGLHVCNSPLLISQLHQAFNRLKFLEQECFSFVMYPSFHSGMGSKFNGLPSVRVLACQRCGKDHQLDFYPLSNPQDEFSFWSICPETKQPVLLSTQPSQKS